MAHFRFNVQATTVYHWVVMKSEDLKQRIQNLWKRHSTNPVISQVTTINSALLLFIHHWYIVFWWNNWKNYPYYSLWRSTRTQILVWKTRKGGRKLLGRVMFCTHFPSPAIICLSEVSLPAYLPVPTETHLTATWGEKPALLPRLTTFNPPFLP